MTATVYNRGQMVIPVQARKQARIDQGDVVLVEPEGDGRIVLTRLEKPQLQQNRVTIHYRRGTHATATAGKPITTEQIKALLADFP